MKICRQLLALLAAGCVAGGCVRNAENLEKLEQPPAEKASEAAPAASDSPDDVARKWYAAVASGDARRAAEFVSGAEAESAALARELAEIEAEHAERKLPFDVKFAAFTPAQSRDDRSTVTIVTDDGRRIVAELRRAEEKWKIFRIAVPPFRRIETPVEVARKWHNAIMSGDVDTANAISVGEKQKKENLDAVMAIRKLGADAANNSDIERELKILKSATFSETGRRATVLVYTGGYSRKILLENINGSWRVVATE